MSPDDQQLLEAECVRYGIEPARLDLLLRHLSGSRAAVEGMQRYENQILTTRLGRFCPGCVAPLEAAHITDCPNLDADGKLRRD